MEEDPIQVIQIDNSSSSETTSTAMDSVPKFSGMLKNLVSSPALLLLLSLATSTISILVYTSVLFEWLAFFLLLSCISIFSSLMVTPLVFFIERCFVMKNVKLFYFLFALKTSLPYFFCSTSLVFSWCVLIKPDMTVSVRHLVTNTLATSVIAVVMWMLNIVILKQLDCHFHDKNFFQNIHAKISDEYILQTLLGLPLGSTDSNYSTLRPHLKYTKRAFNIMLLLLLGCTNLGTICDELVNTQSDNDHKAQDSISAIFRNLTTNEHGDVQETDLLAVMKKEVIADFLRLFDGAAETKRISQDSLTNWMIKVYNERKQVVQLLNTTSKVIEQLKINVLVIQSILVVLVWCLLMGVGTTKSLVYFSPHLLVFGYYCKIIFDGAMLAIVTHPFDIGDHCIIDDDQLVVEDIGLIKTDFLKENGMKLELQNSVLLTKSISNLNRSSELTDTFEIIVNGTPPSEKIAALERMIDELTRSKPENWRAEYHFSLKGVDDVKHVYKLEITDVRKFQNYKVKKYQRTELIDKLRKLFKDLEIMNVTIQ